jgi:hypothetical protein
MTISDDTINRLKREAAEVENADFQHGLTVGEQWVAADDTHFPEIRALYTAWITQQI